MTHQHYSVYSLSPTHLGILSYFHLFTLWFTAEINEAQDQTQERMSPWNEVKCSTEVSWITCSPAHSRWPNFTSALACAWARFMGGAWSLTTYGNNFIALLCNLVYNCKGGITHGRERWRYIAVEENNNWWGRTTKLQILSIEKWLNTKRVL